MNTLEALNQATADLRQAQGAHLRAIYDALNEGHSIRKTATAAGRSIGYVQSMKKAGTP